MSSQYNLRKTAARAPNYTFKSITRPYCSNMADQVSGSHDNQVLRDPSQNSETPESSLSRSHTPPGSASVHSTPERFHESLSHPVNSPAQHSSTPSPRGLQTAVLRHVDDLNGQVRPITLSRSLPASPMTQRRGLSEPRVTFTVGHNTVKHQQVPTSTAMLPNTNNAHDTATQGDMSSTNIVQNTDAPNAVQGDNLEGLQDHGVQRAQDGQNTQSTLRASVISPDTMGGVTQHKNTVPTSAHITNQVIQSPHVTHIQPSTAGHSTVGSNTQVTSTGNFIQEGDRNITVVRPSVSLADSAGRAEVTSFVSHYPNSAQLPHMASA